MISSATIERLVLSSRVLRVGLRATFSNMSEDKGRASLIVPRGRGVRGAFTALSAPPSPQRVTPARKPEEEPE